MDLKLIDLENSKKELQAELTYEELTPYFEKAIEDYRKKASIPGFRKGKAPLNMIKRLYGDGIEYSALDDIAKEVFSKYVVDNKIELLGRGSMTDMDYKPKEKFTFKIEFEVFPDVHIENYKGIELKKKKYVIDESAVDDEINYHKFRNATYELDGIASDDEYIITVDLQNLDLSGNVLIGQNQKGLRIYLNSSQIYPEFKEGFNGIKEGEVRIIDSKNAEGGDKKVQVTCTKVEKIIYPELNKEFFKKVTGKDNITTADEFRNEIRAEVQRIYDGISLKQLRTDTISEMIKLNDVSAPERYIEIILEGMLDDYKHQFQNHQLPKDFNAGEFKKEKRVDAILSAKWYLIRDKLIEMEKIEVDESDYMRIAAENSVKYNIPEEKLIEAYKENEEVKLKLMNDKVLDLIISNAIIEETEEVIKKEEKSEVEQG